MTGTSSRLAEMGLVIAAMQIKVRYKNSWLGYLWSLGHPLGLTLVFAFAFHVVLPLGREDMVAFLVSGLFAWHWAGNSVVAGTRAFAGNRDLIKKVRFPHWLLAAGQVLQDGWQFAASLPVVAVILAVYGIHPRWDWLPGIVLLFAIQAVVLLGLTLLVGSLNMVLRDMEHLVRVVLAFLLYCTPVIYRLDQVPAGWRGMMMLNPLAGLMEAWRSLLLDGTLAWPLMMVASVHGLVWLPVGIAVYRRLSPHFYDHA